MLKKNLVRMEYTQKPVLIITLIKKKHVKTYHGRIKENV